MCMEGRDSYNGDGLIIWSSLLNPFGHASSRNASHLFSYGLLCILLLTKSCESDYNRPENDLGFESYPKLAGKWGTSSQTPQHPQIQNIWDRDPSVSFWEELGLLVICCNQSGLSRPVKEMSLKMERMSDITAQPCLEDSASSGWDCLPDVIWSDIKARV